jgi:hypothetical protein
MSKISNAAKSEIKVVISETQSKIYYEVEKESNIQPRLYYLWSVFRT